VFTGELMLFRLCGSWLMARLQHRKPAPLTNKSESASLMLTYLIILLEERRIVFSENNAIDMLQTWLSKVTSSTTSPIYFPRWAQRRFGCRAECRR
jgi:hypothetical protein